MTKHVLICGPTASGKSGLALAIAERFGGSIVNADALQVYENWSVLTARPQTDDLAKAPHALYGHVAHDAPYSVGHWLREVSDQLKSSGRLIIVGGTGLYLSSLLTGLSEIPSISKAVRDQGDAIRTLGNLQVFLDVLEALDPDTFAKIDQHNGMRLQRAWEVLTETGRPLSEWQQVTTPPLIARNNAHCISVTAPVEQLNSRIKTRFNAMLDLGALEEVRSNLERGWQPDLPSSRALGAAELMAYLTDKMTLEDAIERACIATRQYAKRQRTWFRGRMGDWTEFQSGTAPDSLLKTLDQVD